MASKPTDAQKKRNAAAAVKAALAEGKITDQSLPAWRLAYERNPEGTRAELRQLVAPKIYVPGSASAPVGDKESRLLASTRAALGFPSASNADLPGGGPAQPAVPGSGQPAPITGPASQHLYGGGATETAAPAGQAQVVRSANGNVRYGDASTSVPTMMSAWGQLMVFYGSDWVTIDSFEKLGLLPLDSAMSIQMIQASGTAEARKRLHDGLPAGAALGMV